MNRRRILALAAAGALCAVAANHLLARAIDRIAEDLL